jgi:hypothetical protein
VGAVDRRLLVAGHGLLQAVVALGLLRAGFVATPWPDPLAVPWWGIAAAFFVVEATAFHIEIRRETHTISLSAIPLLLGLLSLPPVGLIAARLVGGGLALTLVRRRFGLKLGWNLTLYAMEAAAAVAIASLALNRGPPTSVWAWLVLLGAVLVAELISLVSVPIVIMLAERELRLSLLSQIARSQLLALLSATFATVTAAAMIGRTTPSRSDKWPSIPASAHPPGTGCSTPSTPNSAPTRCSGSTTGPSPPTPTPRSVPRTC